MKRARILIAGLISMALALAGCGPSARDADESAQSAAPPVVTPDTQDIPAGLDAYYTQEVSWEQCGSMWCANVWVPMDYQDPMRASLSLRVKQKRAQSADAPILLINPGGPGGSGVDMMDQAAFMFTRKLMDAYSVTGFDPRGVGQSTAVECLSDHERDEFRSKTADPSTDEGAAETYRIMADYTQKCIQKSGELLNYVGTENAARDMDILRAVVGGKSTLDYLGFSYGTLLGATYADLFPQRVGRFVLDGALDPTISNIDLARGQARGFEQALRAFVEDCQAGKGCPLTGDVDAGVGQVRELLKSLQISPMPTSDSQRPLTYDLGMMGIIVPLYSEDSWFMLAEGLRAAIKDKDGSMLLSFADMGAERNPDGTYKSNGDEAFVAIGCADNQSPEPLAKVRADMDEFEKISPTFGRSLGLEGMSCIGWPGHGANDQRPLKATGSAPIVVVGTTGDPATIYEWSQALAQQLDNGHLLTFEGNGHTAYRASNSCVAEKIDAFLIDGTVPEEGAICS
ncbi:MAG: alpha/beta hydrolase [Bowdeniella nasicola]|nr:alpha/beta hydrolase [Bowdeniella nasicola]